MAWRGTFVSGYPKDPSGDNLRKFRFDLYVEAGGDPENDSENDPENETALRKIFIEVKGVTLEENGVTRFPDAPSERAVKHLEELSRAVKEGYEAYVVFVIQMKGVRYFTPNIDTHPEFCQALKAAKKAGVHVLAYDCVVEKDSIRMDEEIPVVLESPLLKEAVDPLVCWYRKIIGICRGGIIRTRIGYGFPKSCCSRHGWKR